MLEFTADHDDVPTRGYYFDKLFSPVDYGLPYHAVWVFIAYGESPRFRAWKGIVENGRKAPNLWSDRFGNYDNY